MSRTNYPQLPTSRLDTAAVNRPLRGSAAIVGAATYGCGAAPGMDDMALLVRAAQAAVADAGLAMQDIDGIAVNGSARVVGWVASLTRLLQTGYIYQYAFGMIIGLLVLITLFVSIRY